MEGLQRAENPTQEYPKVFRRDVDGGGGGATRPSAALAPSAPAAHRLLMRCSRAARSMSRASARSQRCCGLRPQRPLAARPSAALAPSAPAGTCIGMRLPRAGQSNLARLLARKPWTPRAFRAKGIKSTGTPHFAPSAKFQLILQVLPTKLQEHLGEQMPKEARRGPSLAMVNINRIQSFNPSLFFKKKGGFQDRIGKALQAGPNTRFALVGSKLN
jgi:hypothetical protein